MTRRMWFLVAIGILFVMACLDVYSQNMHIVEALVDAFDPLVTP